LKITARNKINIRLSNYGKRNFYYEILNSTNGMTKVVPNDALYSLIEQRIQSKSKVATSTLWLIAASIVVLITVNVSLLIHSANSDSKTETVLATTLNKSNQLY
jgi:hypothetical protein